LVFSVDTHIDTSIQVSTLKKRTYVPLWAHSWVWRHFFLWKLQYYLPIYTASHLI